MSYYSYHSIASPRLPPASDFLPPFAQEHCNLQRLFQIGIGSTFVLSSVFTPYSILSVAAFIPFSSLSERSMLLIFISDSTTLSQTTRSDDNFSLHLPRVASLLLARVPSLEPRLKPSIEPSLAPSLTPSSSFP